MLASEAKEMGKSSVMSPRDVVAAMKVRADGSGVFLFFNVDAGVLGIEVA